MGVATTKRACRVHCMQRTLYRARARVLLVDQSKVLFTVHLNYSLNLRMDLDRRRHRLHQHPRMFHHRRLRDPLWALAILRQAWGAWALTREWALSIRLGKTVTWALTRETTVL